MQRCPACHARLNDSRQCPRCAVDLDHVLLSGQLAGQWLNAALHSLGQGRADVAALAVCRSLSFKQTPAARAFKGFLIERQYRALYRQLDQRCWQDARDTLICLQTLLGSCESLERFAEMIDQLSGAY